MALALIRWVMENKRYDGKFLACANKAAAAAVKEASWCNATWLVKLTDGKTGNFLRGSEAGLVDKKEEWQRRQSRRSSSFKCLQARRPRPLPSVRPSASTA